MVAPVEFKDRDIGSPCRGGGLRIRHAFEPTRLSGGVLVRAYERAVPVTCCEVGGWTRRGVRRERRRQA